MYSHLKVFNDRISMLVDDKTLVLNHSRYGIFKIKMNPQGNRIYIKEEIAAYPNWENIPHDFQEEKILSLLFWNCGDWYRIEGGKCQNALLQFGTTLPINMKW